MSKMFRSTGNAAQPGVMSCWSAVMSGTAVQHKFQELLFIMDVMIFRSAGTAAQHEFHELPFIMNVMIFRSAGTAAHHEFQ
jgi:hypothetical protein